MKHKNVKAKETKLLQEFYWTALSTSTAIVGRAMPAMPSLTTLLRLSAKYCASSMTSIIIMQLVSMSWKIISIPNMPNHGYTIAARG